MIHPWERFDGTNTKHYPDYKYIQNEVANPKEVFFPTEFMHGLFDGGQAAGLDDMWKEMMKHPYAAGAFLWSFHDEGVVRVDKHDSIDVAGNGAPDGILGPHREKEASFYSIKEIWSPIYINSDSFKVNRNYINIENRFLFTNLNKCVFKWKVTSFSKPGEAELKYIKQFTGTIKSPSLKPGQKGILKFPIPTGDVFYIIALDLKGDTICTWSWPLIQPIDVVKKHFKTNNEVDIHLKEDKETLSIKDENILYQFDIKNGFLSKIITGNKTVSLNGPTYAGKNQYIKTFQITQESGKYNLSISYIGDSLHVVWTFQNGRLPQMKYSYIPEDSSDYCGITFNYPEEKITGIKWMGKGPYRVWKNRIKGQQFGVWNKKYNNTVTGQNWIYPEFKGWHSDLYWVQFQNTESNFIIYIDQPKIYLQILNPEKPIAANNNNTSPGFPPGTFGFMHAISPIGTKFQKADLMGPQSEKNRVSLGSRFEGTLYFDFR